MDANEQFSDARDLVKALLKNRELLTRQEEAFNACVAPLSEARRRVVYKYIATLTERIRLLTEKVEEIAEEYSTLLEQRETNAEKGNEILSRNEGTNERSAEETRSKAQAIGREESSR